MRFVRLSFAALAAASLGAGYVHALDGNVDTPRLPAPATTVSTGRLLPVQTTTSTGKPPPVVHASRGKTTPRLAGPLLLPDGSPCRWPKPGYCFTDDPFDVLSACEAGMNPTRVSPSGKYRGAYMFALPTWRGVGETGDPIDYDYPHQKAAAQRLQARSGWGQWPTCSRILGLA